MTQSPPAEARVEQRFWAKVDRREPDRCWTWLGARSGSGYGSFGYRGATQKAHRVAWALTNGTLPDPRTFVCHRCDNPSCVNPAHLFLGDCAANVADREAKGRRPAPKGVTNGRAKLTENDVRAIRADTRTLAAIAAEYGMTRKYIWQLRNRKTWAHVE